MKFKKIVSVDYTGLIDEVKEKILKLGEDVVFYDDYPREEEIIKRIGNADCLLVSWNTPIREEVLKQCPSLKYIGMCYSLIDENSANVDVRFAKTKGITVLGVRDYGDEGVVEFIISELVRLLHGIGKYQWKEHELELTNQKIGIIGLGGLGQMLAHTALGFGMDVYYYNRSRKYDIEEKGVKYLHIEDLLERVDILSTHLPRNTVVLKSEEFQLFGNNKIIVNTSLEPTFEIKAFHKWIEEKGNYAIFDRVAMGKYYDDLKGIERVIYTHKTTGWTYQAKVRLSQKVLKNLEEFTKDYFRKETKNEY